MTQSNDISDYKQFLKDEDIDIDELIANLEEYTDNELLEEARKVFGDSFSVDYVNTYNPGWRAKLIVRVVNKLIHKLKVAKQEMEKSKARLQAEIDAVMDSDDDSSDLDLSILG